MGLISRIAARRPWLTLAAWIAILLISAPLAAKQSDALTGGGFTAPGSDSAEAESVIAEAFPDAKEAGLAALIVTEPQGSESELRDARANLAEAVEKTQDVHLAELRSPAAEGVFAPRKVGSRLAQVVPLQHSVGEDQSVDVADDLNAALDETGTHSSADLYLIGQGALIAGVQERAKQDLERAERSGFPLILIVLLIIFGSIAAALVPFAIGIAAITVTGAVIFALAQLMEMSIYVTTLASMVGIGVSVDYSLFLVARYREEMNEGRSPTAARKIALATSGRSVAFSGLTVVVALAGLLVVDNTALRSMALGAMVVVAVSVLAALTIVPAALSLAGERLGRRNRYLTPNFRRRRMVSRAVDGSTFWQRWSEAVMRNAAITAAVSSVLLLLLATPVVALTTHTGALSQLPEEDAARKGNDLAREALGADISPTKIVIRFNGGSARSREEGAAAIRATIAIDRGVASVSRPRLGEDGQTYLVEASSKASVESQSAKEMVERLRQDLPRAAESFRASNAEILVGGVTAAQRDGERQIAESLWLVLCVVLLLSIGVLMFLLRSIVLPLKSVILNLLSVGAAYGVLVIVFQWGWLDGLFGFQSPGYIDTLTLPLVLAVVFGLSMDYEVFLLSRIRERYLAGESTSDAVVKGLSASAAAITSAAFIMVTVFSVFVATSVPSIQEIGLGAAVAVALDATIVRLTLVPSAMVLLGRWNWWLPEFMERRLTRASKGEDVLQAEVGG